MEIKQLEVYVKVYELRSFSKAADEMFLSQPSISAYIKALEKELQVNLIARSTKEFIPTKSGTLLYEHAKEILSMRDKAINSIKNLLGSTSGSVDILASSVPAQYILPEILGAFHKEYPDIVFNINQVDTIEVVKGISEHKAEIGFVGTKVENSKCIYEKFMSEKLIMIAPKDKRFENIDANNIATILLEEYFVMREVGSGTRLVYEKYLKALGINLSELKISASFSNTQSIIHAVASGLGLSIVSELAAKHYIEQKAIIPIYIDSLPERDFYAVQKKSYINPAIVDIFMDFIRLYK
ncbi:MAG: selenium metabolism-associated LysR family transcriptional regulator [Defluviitaleaceae bacterium]|nr:selenium metabolism-associated LysR family transcriptional regulator [Defluviitaleaceae bacterium]